MDLSLSRKLSILAYLSKHSPVLLRDLAAHYGISPAKMQQDLQDLFLVEITDASGYFCPIDIFVSEDGGNESYVSLSATSASDLPQVNLGFDELIAVISWIDYLLRIADPLQMQALLNLRAKLCDAATAQGYADALWAAPTHIIDYAVLEKINQALTLGKQIRFLYWKAAADSAKADCMEVYGTPLELITLHQPLLRLVAPAGIRTFRLDRMTAVQLGQKRQNQKQLNALRVKANAEKFSFQGGTVLLECTFAAQWLVETYPGVRQLSESAALQWRKNMRQSIDKTIDKTSTYETSVALAQNQTALENLSSTNVENAPNLQNPPDTHIWLELAYKDLASLFAILVRLGKALISLTPAVAPATAELTAINSPATEVSVSNASVRKSSKNSQSLALNQQLAARAKELLTFYQAENSCKILEDEQNG